MKDYTDYSLLAYNTFGISAKCRRFIEFSSVEELQQVARSLGEADQPLLILGGGSNLLLTGDFEGTVLHSAIRGHEVVAGGSGEPTVLLRCGSGETWDDVVALCVEQGWHGAENLSLIPGEVGATAVQNIGAYGAEAKDIIETVETVELATGEKRTMGNAECHYAYRQSRFKGEWSGRYVVTHVTYRLQTTFVPHLDYGNIRSELERRGIGQPTAADVRQVIIDIRNAKLPDPKEQGNAGSFFMNPVVGRAKYDELAARYPQMPHYTVDEEHEKIPAGWMIDHCGWKGRSVGRAGVHDRQALVLVNRGGATGDEVLRLCRMIQSDVKQTFGIDIHPEVNIR